MFSHLTLLTLKYCIDGLIGFCTKNTVFLLTNDLEGIQIQSFFMIHLTCYIQVSLLWTAEEKSLQIDRYDHTDQRGAEIGVVELFPYKKDTHINFTVWCMINMRLQRRRLNVVFELVLGQKNKRTFSINAFNFNNSILHTYLHESS